MKFDNNKLSLPNMNDNDVQKFTIIVINDTNEPKTFALDPCCNSCTTLYYKKHKLEAREQLDVEAQFKANGIGNFKKCIKLVSDGEIKDKLWFSLVVVEK